MKRNCSCLIIFFLNICMALGQVGGSHTYDFLNLTNSGSVAALGGIVVSTNDYDLNMTYHNPALLDGTMDKNLVMNYVNYFSDINFGYFNYARKFGIPGTFAAGIHYINYGRFIATDPTGAINGNFSASEYAINIMYSRPVFDSLIHVGVTLKPIFSNFERYSSFGIAADLGVHYVNKQGLFSAGLVFKNFGFQIKPYTSGNSEPLPFEIQAGISQKLKHAPLRFLLNVHHINRFNLSATTDAFTDGGSDPFNTADLKSSGFEQFSENLLRHFIFGVEFNPVKPLVFRAGFNYNRRQELKMATKVSTVGFSWGLGLNLTKFQLSYGRATYHLAGASNHISLTLNLKEFGRKGL